MNDRFSHIMRNKRVQVAAASAIEFLESRAYLSALTLGTPTNIAAGSVGIAPVFANLADFNGDGKADLFVANTTNSVSVLLSTTAMGATTASFGAPVTIPVAGPPLPLATGNFTNSGHLDIVAGTTGSPGDVSVILGNGDGTFKAANNYPALYDNQAIAVGDFNNDGQMSVITVSNNPTPTGNAEILYGDGAGHLTGTHPFNLAFGSVSTVAVGDFNGDGNLDFVVANQLNNSVSVYLGNGNGTFQAPQTYQTGPSPTSMVVADFTGQTLGNGKPKLDIVTADSTGGEVSFLSNMGNGTFAAPVNSPVAGSGPGGGPLKVRLANFTNSGSTTEQDLVVLLSPNSTADASVLLGNGDGTFHTGTSVSTHGGTRNAFAAGDINGDALTDVVLTNSTTVTSLINTSFLDTSTPTALVSTPTVSASSLGSTITFSVTYSDSLGNIDTSTLGAGNLMVSIPVGAGGGMQAATLVPGQTLNNAGTVTAQYQITLASNLTNADAGTYTVTMNPSSVLNAGKIAVAGGAIGSFTVNVVNTDNKPPTATVDLVQNPGVAGSTTYDFTVTYADNVAVNAATIATGNLSVTFPLDIKTETPTLKSVGLTNGATVVATYEITFTTPLSAGAGGGSGGYTVTAASSPVVADTSGNALATGTIGTFTLTVSSAPDTTPPTATVDPNPPTPTTGATTYTFGVTYADDVDVDQSTLGAGNLTVTPPGGGTPIAATLVSPTGLTGGATSVDATYQITFPAGLSVANNGTYTVNLGANPVKDTSGNAVAIATVGTFAFNLVEVPPTGDFAVSAVTGKLPASAVSGAKQKIAPSVTITYNGATTLTKAILTVNLYASKTQINDSTATPVGAVTIKAPKLKPGKIYKVHFKPFFYPGTAGSYYLVSDVAVNGTLDSYDGATATPIVVAAAFVDGNAVAAAPVKATLAAGVKASAFITVENLGNVTYSGPATVDVAVVPVGGGTATTVATAVPITIKLLPSQTKKVKLNFTPANLPASGSYNIKLTLHLPGDTNAVNDVVTSSAVVTI